MSNKIPDPIFQMGKFLFRNWSCHWLHKKNSDNHPQCYETLRNVSFLAQSLIDEESIFFN